MHEKRREGKQEKTTEAKQITARNPKGNKGKKKKEKRKNQTSNIKHHFTLLAGNRTCHPSHPSHPNNTRPPTATHPISHLSSTTSHFPSPISNLQPPTSKHIRTSRLTHTHPLKNPSLTLSTLLFYETLS
jgi:hypothetical protein